MLVQILTQVKCAQEVNSVGHDRSNCSSHGRITISEDDPWGDTEGAIQLVKCPLK